MNPSKENARKTREILDSGDISADRSTSPEDDSLVDRNLAFIREFLEAVERRLPTEASFERERQRKRRYAEAKYKKATAEYAASLTKAVTVENLAGNEVS